VPDDGEIQWRDEGLEILDEDECLQLLGRVPVGRVAVSAGALPAVFPVNFALYGRRIVFRTGRGTKLDAAVRNTVVAFEVDEFDTLYHGGWSVLAVGRASDITENLELIGGDGRIRPWATGERDHYVCIDIELLSGRRITHSAG
jgi:nitroimidazol reductase NimA-like FMN-containing flavoprotein (pyridoxamine 5'-phosphate oxidase superfamily)